MHHKSWEASNHENDPAPEPGCIDNRLSPFDSAYDVQRHALRLSPQRPRARQVCRHRRGDEARADIEHGHAVAVEPVPKALKEALQSALGGSVHEVAGSATLTRNGGDASEDPGIAGH